MRDSGRLASLTDFLREHRGEHHILALQDYPDPDAIASAMAHQKLSEAFDTRADLVFAGEISHHQNRKLVELLGVDLNHLRDGYALGGHDGAVFIDNQGATCAYLVRMLAHSGVPALAVVDHHEGESMLRPELRVVESIGATATLYAELLRQGVIRLDPASPEGRRLASGLLFGILTDTHGLTFAKHRDRAAAAWLLPYSDQGLLLEVEEQPVSPETREILRRAETTQVMRGGFIFAGVGYLHARDRDAIPQAATRLLARRRAHSCVTFGIVRDWRLREALTGSLRTVLANPSPATFLHHALASTAGDARLRGGRAFAGGFEIPLGMSTRAHSVESQLVRWAYYEQLLLDRLIRAADEEGEVELFPRAERAMTLDPIDQDSFDRWSPVWRVLDRRASRAKNRQPHVKPPTYNPEPDGPDGDGSPRSAIGGDHEQPGDRGKLA